MISKLKEDLLKINPKWRTRFVEKHDDALIYFNQFYPDIELKEAIYLFINDITKPTCKCGKNVSFFSNRYAKYCSKQCANKYNNNIVMMNAALAEKYNVNNAAFLSDTFEKRKKTMINKYGAMITEKHISNNSDHHIHLNTKGRETLFKNHSVINPGQLTDHARKLKIARDLVIKDVKKQNEKCIERFQALMPSTIKILEIIPPNKSEGEFNYRYSFSCNKCNNVEIHPSETLKFRIRSGNLICSECSGITRSRSIQEIKIYEFIKELIPNQIIKITDRITIKPYELDIFLPEKQIAIEYNGLFYHNEDKKGKNYHINKYNLCKEKGIRLIQIFEDEWIFKQQIVKDRIKHLLKRNTSSSIYARKCITKEITSSEARFFCDNHHIQGYAQSSFKYGLFYDSKLIAVMTFAKLNKAKGQKEIKENFWELSRFCTNGNIVGAAGKLFQYFIRNVKPKNIISYSDIRWNTGNLYKTLGFIHTHDSRPNYWYVKGNNRIHRYKLRKTENDDKKISEKTIRL